jgi:hypothetical protein
MLYTALTIMSIVHDAFVKCENPIFSFFPRVIPSAFITIQAKDNFALIQRQKSLLLFLLLFGEVLFIQIFLIILL